MMDFVHVESNKENSQYAVSGRTHLDVGVLQLRVNAGSDEIDSDDPKRETENKNC